MSTTTIRRRQVSLADHADHTRTVLAGYEHRYRCSSSDMLNAVRAGKARETADIAVWMFNYRVLTRLEALSGPPRIV